VILLGIVPIISPSISRMNSYRTQRSDTRQFDAFENDLAPGTEFPGHRHHTYDEAIYVVAGEVTITVASQTTRFRAGAWVHIPKGVLHSFRNAGDGQARIVLWQLPVSEHASRRH
jgi:quercetin dioxygenase-like cupin family protein